MARRFDSSLDDPATLAALGLTPADIALITNPSSGGGVSSGGGNDHTPLTVASATAREALTGLLEGAHVKETDTALTYEVVDPAHLSTDAGWNIVGGTTDALLARIISNIFIGGTINLQDADEPTDLVPERVIIQIPPLEDISTEAGAAFRIVQFSGADYEINVRFDFALSGSSVSADNSGDQALTIGLSDSPTPAQVATKIAALTNTLVNFPMVTATAAGDQVTIECRDFKDWPLALHDNNLGLILSAILPGTGGRVGFLAANDWDITVKINGIVRHWAP